MPVDAANSLEAFVLVDGRRVPELADPDASPRDWSWMTADAVLLSLHKHAPYVASLKRSTTARRHKCVIATSAGIEFELGLVNRSATALCVDSYVDGQLIDRFSLFGAQHSHEAHKSPEARGTASIEGDYISGTGAQNSTVRRMSFAQINSEASEGGSPGEVGRIDVVMRPILNMGDIIANNDKGLGPGAATKAGVDSKKKVFGLKTQFGAERALATYSETRRDEWDVNSVLAVFSFRYAAIEALHLAKTTPKAWLDAQTAAIETARKRSRELRTNLRAGYAISEPPTYLFSHKLAPLAGAGAPRAFADVAALDKALRADGFKLCGEKRGLFEALSHQLCGTHALARYVEHVVLEELELSEQYGGRNTRVEFEDEYAHLFRPAKSPLKMPLDWRDHVRLRAGACDGTVVLNQRYDDDAALADDPPPLAPGDLVVVAPEDGVGDPYEASVQPGGDDTHVVVKELGKSSEAIRHTSPRLGGGGPKSRRGAYVAATQTSILAQAFANAFGVRLFLLMTTKGRKLRVVRVEPRNGRRVLINGYAVAHLGGVCFDSVERHHDVIEIADDTSEDEEEDVKPEPPAKKHRTSSPRASAPRVKRER